MSEMSVEDQMVLAEITREAERCLPTREQLESGGLEFSIVAAAGMPGGGRLNPRRHTFKVDRRERGGETKFFVDYRLRHSDEWVYLGMYDPDAGSDEAEVLRLTTGSRMTEDATPVRLFRWAAHRIVWCDGAFRLPEGYTCEWITGTPKWSRT